MKIYVAGSSKEIDRAELWMKNLRREGFIVTSTWPEVIRSVGASNPMNASLDEYRLWASKDLGEVEAAQAFWLLLPTTQTIGAYVEIGYASALRKLIATSGEHKPIFTPALAHVHAPTDEMTFDHLCRLRDKITLLKASPITDSLLELVPDLS